MISPCGASIYDRFKTECPVYGDWWPYLLMCPLPPHVHVPVFSTTDKVQITVLCSFRVIMSSLPFSVYCICGKWHSASLCKAYIILRA
uniref:Uncharacterized protein n=1 Tax=Pyxicephalus adspersus TaxID=30357 RepID=A0AAV3AJX5_PYXAD|nr:TPA: hypothetical protein GDO54_014057 [Pyxicephalus adspersus]